MKDTETRTTGSTSDTVVGSYCIRCMSDSVLETSRIQQVVNMEDLEDDEEFQDERDIWEDSHVSEEELETTEGEGVDLLVELLELVGW